MLKISVGVIRIGTAQVQEFRAKERAGRDGLDMCRGEIFDVLDKGC